MNAIKKLFYAVYKVYFILVFVLIFLLLYPFFLIGFHLIKNVKYTYFLHRIWAILLNILTLIFLRIEVIGKPLPNEPFIIIANHTSFLDVFLMCKLLPHHPFVFMAKSELLKAPLFNILFKYYHIPVYRSNRKKAAEAISKGKNALNKGLCVAIFPEGGIIDGYAPRVAPFKNGAFELALHENVGILPITFLSNFKIIGDAEKIFSVSRPGIAKAIIHPYISKEEVQSMDIKTLKSICFEIIEKPLKEKYGF